MSVLRSVTPRRFADAVDLETMLEATSPRLMGSRLSAALGFGSVTCRVLDAKYEPGVRAIVLYDVGGQLVRGDVRAGERQPSPRAGRSTTIAPGVEIAPFPNDPDMPNLPLVADGDLFGPWLMRDGFPDARPRRCRVQLLRYRPGKRATFLVTFTPGEGRYVAKVYHRSDKARAVAAEGEALGAMARGAGEIGFAALAASVSELDTVVHHVVPGLALDALVEALPRSRRLVGDAVERAGRALATLHRLPRVTIRRRSTSAELNRFVERGRRVATADPALGDAAVRVAVRLMEVEGALVPPSLGPVHGDCKPSAFRVADQLVYALDLDHHGIADQAGDVGTFLASLRQLAIRDRLARRASLRGRLLDGLRDLFLRGYLGADDDEDKRHRVDWQTAVALERKALRAFMRAPRSPLSGALLEEASRMADRAQRRLA